MEIQAGLLILAAFWMCCDATIDTRENSQLPQKDRLIGSLLQFYEKDAEPPVTTPGHNTTVNFALSLIRISPSSDRSEITVHSWVSMTWRDARLTWSPDDTGNVQALRISANRIWKPDIRLYNELSSQWSDVSTVIFSDGTVTWIPPVNFVVSSCQNIHRNVFNCTMKFGSWSYSGDILDLRYTQGGAVDVSNYVANSQVDLQKYESRRRVNYYTCCPEPYISITIRLQLQINQAPRPPQQM